MFRFSSPPTPMKYKQIKKNGVEVFLKKNLASIFEKKNKHKKNLVLIDFDNFMVLEVSFSTVLFLKQSKKNN